MVAERRLSMPRILLLGGVACAMLFSGCATVSMIEEPHVEAFAMCDADFIARVEREAKRHGSAIRWYRCPQYVPSTQPPPHHYGDTRDV